MAHHRKPVRSLAAGLAGLLLALVAWAQDGSVVAGAPDQATRIEVKGVLIGPRSQSALIYGRVLRVGDYVGGVEIVAIDQREVRLRTENRETGVVVGTSQSMDTLYWSPATSAQIETAESQIATVMDVPKEPAPSQDMPRRHAVGAGETLSEIAEAYLVPGVRRYQLMVALFEANPHAFRGNINRLRAGVVLDIPDTQALANLSPESAMAKVMEHTDRWRSERPRQPKKSQPVVADTYGPVSSGETLSLIAQRLSQNGGDARTMMAAIYRINPHAFGDSMNMLREGAVLQIPGPFDGVPPAPGTVVAHLSPD